MDGYELRPPPAHRAAAPAQTPIIFLTAEYDEGDATELARAAGVTRVLRKPQAGGRARSRRRPRLGESPKTTSTSNT